MVKTWRAIGIETEYCNNWEAIIRFGGCFFCAQKGGKEAGGIGPEVEERHGGCGQKGGESDSPDGGWRLCCGNNGGSDVSDGIRNGYFWGSERRYAAGIYGCGWSGDRGGCGVRSCVFVPDEFLQVRKDRG